MRSIAKNTPAFRFAFACTCYPHSGYPKINCFFCLWLGSEPLFGCVWKQVARTFWRGCAGLLSRVWLHMSISLSRFGQKKVLVIQPLRSHLMISGTNWWTKSCTTGAWFRSSKLSRCQQLWSFCCNWQVSGDIKFLETALKLAYIDLSGTEVQGALRTWQMLSTISSCLILARHEILVTAIWTFVPTWVSWNYFCLFGLIRTDRSQRNKELPVPSCAVLLKLTMQKGANGPIAIQKKHVEVGEDIML